MVFFTYIEYLGVFGSSYFYLYEVDSGDIGLFDELLANGPSAISV